MQPLSARRLWRMALFTSVATIASVAISVRQQESAAKTVLTAAITWLFVYILAVVSPPPGSQVPLTLRAKLGIAALAACGIAFLAWAWQYSIHSAAR